MSIELTKWPRLLVTGEPVSEERAEEILIRTSHWYLMTNDREWERLVYDAIGIGYTRDEYGAVRVTSEDLRNFEDELGVLRMSYLDNARVASAWIGGPKGWINWDGTVGCANYNIGKWPSVSEVTEDWLKIARVFPDLNLTAQLVPEEGEAGYAAATWHVRGGDVAVDLDRNEKLIREPEEIDDDWMFKLLNNDPTRERGVDIERLRAAVDRLRAKRSG